MLILTDASVGIRKWNEVNRKSFITNFQPELHNCESQNIISGHIITFLTRIIHCKNIEITLYVSKTEVAHKVIYILFSLLFLKRKVRLMRSPVHLSVPPPLITFEPIIRFS
jgi:hypothetical protein